MDSWCAQNARVVKRRKFGVAFAKFSVYIYTATFDIIYVVTGVNGAGDMRAGNKQLFGADNSFAIFNCPINFAIEFVCRHRPA